MPKSTNRNRKIPKFVKKLYEILQDNKYQHLIAWLTDANGFQILNTSRFIEQVLPNYFRHNNMASFVRQLNMYGFCRPKDSSQHVYIHPRFIKGNMNSIRQIQRKVQDDNIVENHQKLEQQEESSEEKEEEVSSAELNELCKQLLEQNQKLKKQNQQLNSKLNEMNRNKKIIESLPFFAFANIELSNCKGAENNFINNQETMVQKIQQSSERKPIHSFNFAENHCDQSSRLSYLSLVNGARDQGKMSSDQENKQ